MGTSSLQDCFPKLFQVAENKESNIADMGVWNGEFCSWEWRWRDWNMFSLDI